MKPAVLIVDDSLTIRMDLQEAFAAAGFAPQACDSLAGARALLAGGDFALVVLDVLLPDGDGVELLRQIKSGPKPLPIMLLSTEAEVRDRMRGLRTGADEYVGKPYEAVQVWNINTGQRLETYVIPAARDSGEICLNGAAARLAEQGDLIIICSFCWLDEEQARHHVPQTVRVDGRNRVLSGSR